MDLIVISLGRKLMAEMSLLTFFKSIEVDSGPSSYPKSPTLIDCKQLDARHVSFEEKVQ